MTRLSPFKTLAAIAVLAATSPPAFQNLMPLRGALLAAAPVYVVPRTIPSNCSKDVSAEMNRWISQVPNNSVIELRAGGCYDMERGLYLGKRSNIVFDGNGALLRARTTGAQLPPPKKGWARKDWPASRQDLVIVASTHVTVENLRIRGPDSTGAWTTTYANQTGVQIDGGTAVDVHDVSVSNVYGDGFGVGGVPTIGPANDITLSDDSTFETGRNGMSDYDGNNVSFVDNTVGSCHFVHFDIEPLWVGRPRSTRDVTIEGNIVEGSGSFVSNQGNGGSFVGNIKIVGNQLYGLPMSIIVGGSAGGTNQRIGYVIEGNVSNTPALYKFRGLMSFADARDVTVEGNIQPFLHRESPYRTVAIVTTGSTSLTVTGNDFPGLTKVLVNGAPGATVVAPAKAGGREVTTGSAPTSLEAYWLGTGPHAQKVTVTFWWCKNGICHVDLGQIMLYSQRRGQTLSAALSTDVLVGWNQTGS